MYRSNERLFDLIAPVASSAGHELRVAEFRKTKEFQASWKKHGAAIDFFLSDYLADAPDDVITDFTKSIMSAVSNKRPRYNKTYIEWVTSDAFVREKRKIYLKRSKNLTRDPTGRERDLISSLDRLLDAELLDANDISNSFFSWTSHPNIRKVGFCSPMMRVVGISSLLDDVSVPEYVLDYVVYHESLHLARGYRPGARAHDTEFRRSEKAYPDYEKAKKYLTEICNRK